MGIRPGAGRGSERPVPLIRSGGGDINPGPVIPDLDRLAAAALRETARMKRKLVERDVVTHVIEADTRERD